MSPSPAISGSQSGSPEFRQFVEAVADDLRLLALLHDQEPTLESIEALRSCPFQEQLSILLCQQDGQAALEAFDQALADLPEPLDKAAIDDLWAEHANVYLRYLYRASPAESVWFDDEGLERQQSMFSVREWYRRHNMKAGDWSRRSDDHIVLELGFVAHLFGGARRTKDLEDAAAFLDQHLLTWCGLFAGQLADAGAAPYFTALAHATERYLEEIRDHLADMTGVARTLSEKTPATPHVSKEELTSETFAPGAGPGW